MEMYYICFLTVLAVVFMILWLVFHYLRESKATQEQLLSLRTAKDEAMERITRLEEQQASRGNAGQPSPTDEGRLTVDGIADAVRAAGYVPQIKEDRISFVRDDELYSIDTSRMPRIFLSKAYRVDPKDWNIDLVRQAAHLMSDDVIMVKAFISDEPDEDGELTITFFLAAMDRTFAGFRENLIEYIRIIEGGQANLGEFYEKLDKEKQDAASLNGLASNTFNQNGKTPS